jgi:3-deoxy-D-manno-octulosonic-acid transferase
LEAAVWDIPVFFGPNNQKFQEAQALKQNGGQEIHDYKEFEQLMNRFIAEPSFLQEQGRLAGQYVKSLAGATELVLSSVGSRLDS